MKNNMVAKLRSSIFAVSAASLALVAPAYADAGEQQKNAQQKVPEFSQLDKNKDQKITKEELQGVAQQGQMNAEHYIVLFDLDDDRALNENEFNQLKDSGTLTSAPGKMAKQGNDYALQQQSEQQNANKPEGAKIMVDQKPTQVTVNKPAAQVTIDQPKPKVTITTQDPKVQVEQAEPRVSVQQPKPQVSVDQAKPEVEIQDAEPNVQVRNSQPQVQVNKQEPEVAIQPADQNQQQQSASQQQAKISQQSANQEQDVFAVAVVELREAEVIDKEGQAIGNVEEVVIKRDGSEAGFIISTTGSDAERRHVYRPADDFSLDGNQLMLNEDAGAEALREPQGFVSQDFRAAPNDQGTLGDLTNREGLSAR